MVVVVAHSHFFSDPAAPPVKILGGGGGAWWRISSASHFSVTALRVDEKSLVVVAHGGAFSVTPMRARLKTS